MATGETATVGRHLVAPVLRPCDGVTVQAFPEANGGAGLVRVSMSGVDGSEAVVCLVPGDAAYLMSAVGMACDKLRRGERPRRAHSAGPVRL